MNDNKETVDSLSFDRKMVDMIANTVIEVNEQQKKKKYVADLKFYLLMYVVVLLAVTCLVIMTITVIESSLSLVSLARLMLFNFIFSAVLLVITILILQENIKHIKRITLPDKE